MAITKKDLASPKDIIAYFVSKLNNWINVAGVDDLGGNQWKILTCNTKWAQKGFIIPDIGRIIDVDINNSITVESETEILLENFELYPVKFVHGTAIQVNIENFTGENSLDPKLRLPVVYLREFTEMTRQSKWSNNLVRIEIPLTLYFLTKGNHDTWKTSDAYNEAIYPMKNLVDEFQKVLYKEKGNVGNWTEDTLNFHPKFGVRYVKKQNTDSKGVEVNYFDDNLTGVECNINLPLKIDFCNRCKDYIPPIPIESISLFVNENLFKVYTESPANIAIRNSLGNYVGTLDPDNGLVLIADTTIQLKDSLGTNIGSPQTFASETIDQITAPDGIVNIRKTGGGLIEAKPVVSNGEVDAEIADSTITNDPTTPTYTQPVKATENLILPAQNILVNAVNEGQINSVGDIEIVTNTPPTTVDVTGRVITMDFPPNKFDVNLADRFGNDLGTKQVNANANWDLRTLTPFDWADIYIAANTATFSGLEETAIYDFYDALISGGIFQKMYAMYPMRGADTALSNAAINGRYPVGNLEWNNYLEFIGSATGSTNGVQLNGTTQILRTRVMSSNLKAGSKQISIYKRNTTFSPAALSVWFSAGSANPLRIIFLHDTTNARLVAIDKGTTTTGTFANAAETQGLISLRRTATSGTGVEDVIRNGSVLYTNNAPTVGETQQEILIGGQMASNKTTLQLLTALDLGYAAIFREHLTDTEEAAHFTAVQALMTAFGANV